MDGLSLYVLFAHLPQRTPLECTLPCFTSTKVTRPFLILELIREKLAIERPRSRDRIMLGLTIVADCGFSMLNFRVFNRTPFAMADFWFETGDYQSLPILSIRNPKSEIRN
jgi:hypothetical protein